MTIAEITSLFAYMYISKQRHIKQRFQDVAFHQNIFINFTHNYAKNNLING